LNYLVCFWICNQEKYNRGIKAVLCFQRNVHLRAFLVLRAEVFRRRRRRDLEPPLFHGTLGCFTNSLGRGTPVLLATVNPDPGPSAVALPCAASSARLAAAVACPAVVPVLLTLLTDPRLLPVGLAGSGAVRAAAGLTALAAEATVGCK
jgi:hypothetical protein